MAKSFRDLVMWQKGVRLSVIVYQLTKSFPREDLYGLTSQMRRAAVSIPSNIAEGCGRLNTKEYRHFLGIARGSYFEFQTHLAIAKELGFCDSAQVAVAEELSNEVGKMLQATIATLKESIADGTMTNH